MTVGIVRAWCVVGMGLGKTSGGFGFGGGSEA